MSLSPHLDGLGALKPAKQSDAILADTSLGAPGITHNCLMNLSDNNKIDPGLKLVTCRINLGYQSGIKHDQIIHTSLNFFVIFRSEDDDAIEIKRT